MLYEVITIEPSRSSSEPSTVALVGDLKDSHQTLSGADLTSAEFPASWPMFGTDFRMKMGGYIKTDFVIDFDGTTDPSQFRITSYNVCYTKLLRFVFATRRTNAYSSRRSAAWMNDKRGLLVQAVAPITVSAKWSCFPLFAWPMIAIVKS